MLGVLAYRVAAPGLSCAEGDVRMLSEIIWNEATIAIVMGCAIPIVGVISAVWYKAAKTTSENDLKRRMVERGMSVDEIERVLAAKSDS